MIKKTILEIVRKLTIAPKSHREIILQTETTPQLQDIKR